MVGPDAIAPAASFTPPKKGLTKVQRGFTNPVSDNCPCMAICQKLGTFRQGSCFIGTADTHKCLVANNMLLARSLASS